MTAKQNWVQIPGAIFTHSDAFNDMSDATFQDMVKKGHKANINLNDVFGFDGNEENTMVFINRLHPQYALLDIPVDQFTKVFFEEEEKSEDRSYPPF